MHLTNGATVMKAVTGDTGDARVVQLGGDEQLDLADTFSAHMYRFGVAATTAAVLLDPDERTVLVQLDPWLPTAAPGQWALEVAVRWGTTELTYPSATEDRVTIDVRADYG